jgi:predicted N-formylglutamate amidohydrolase
MKGADVRLHIGDTPRTVCDLNRDACYSTPFREALRRDMARARAVLDVHSYPAVIGEWRPFDVVILAHPDEKAVGALRTWRALRASGVHVLLDFNSSPMNSIVREARDVHRVPFVALLEFNEESATDVALRAAAAAIVTAMPAA